ncbi:MAG: hypothetical protein DRI46_08420 [Chloroflexi bacterium]|nr:MAG: hypothetical protein DRI46_08420 [Chloroflexota bacterium]
MTDLDGNTSGQTGQTTQATGQTTQTTHDGGDAARLADFQSQLARHKGDALNMAERYHEKNYQLRQRAQAAEAQIPKEGSVVITADEATLLKTYKTLGTPTEITEKGTTLSKLQKYQMVSEAAQVAGMNPKVLSRLLPEAAVLEIGEANDENGVAKRTVLFVEGETKTPLDKYAEASWKDFLPALNTAQDSQQVGTPWIQQQGSTAGDAGSGGMHPLLKKQLDAAEKRAAPQQSD